MLEQFMKSCSLCEGPRLEQGKSERSPPPAEEGAAEETCDEQTTTPLPHPPVPLRGGGREFGSKIIPGRREG